MPCVQCPAESNFFLIKSPSLCVFQMKAHIDVCRFRSFSLSVLRHSLNPMIFGIADWLRHFPGERKNGRGAINWTKSVISCILSVHHGEDLELFYKFRHTLSKHSQLITIHSHLQSINPTIIAYTSTSILSTWFRSSVSGS